MKKLNGFIVSITKHHINPKFLLTPISIAYYDVDGVRIKMMFLFGFRIYRQSIIL